MSTTTKFTAGPWVLGFDHHRTEVRAGDSRTGRRIASTFMSDSRAAIEINEANARLIAASPTMYSYIAARAESGDPKAAEIVEAINAAR